MFGRYYVGNPFSFNVATPFFVWTKKYSASGSNRILHVLMSLTSVKKKWARFLVRSKATLPKSLDPSGLPKRYLFYLKNLAESLTWWVSFSSFETLIFYQIMVFVHLVFYLMQNLWKKPTKSTLFL